MSTGNFKKLPTRLVQKHDTETNWNTASENGFVPLRGEFIIYEEDENYDKSRVKVGDGSTVVSDLPFFGDTDESLTQSGVAADAKITGEKISVLEQQMADILYEEIAISSFTHNAGTKERGSTVTNVTLSWKTNKTPTTLTLDGESLDVNTTSKEITGLSLTWDNNKTWKLIATDAREAVAEKSVSITFCNGIYYGVGSIESAFDSAFVTGLTKRLQTSKAYDFTVNPTAQYIYYVVPKRLGTVSFKVGGFEGGFESPEVVSVTNSSDYTEDYYVYRSTNQITGSTTVDVT